MRHGGGVCLKCHVLEVQRGKTSFSALLPTQNASASQLPNRQARSSNSTSRNVPQMMAGSVGASS